MYLKRLDLHSFCDLSINLAQKLAFNLLSYIVPQLFARRDPLSFVVI